MKIEMKIRQQEMCLMLNQSLNVFKPIVSYLVWTTEKLRPSKLERIFYTFVMEKQIIYLRLRHLFCDFEMIIYIKYDWSLFHWLLLESRR